MSHSLRFGYVDFNGHGGPRSGVEYRCLDAADPVMADVAVGDDVDADTGAYAALVQVLTMWVANMPDLWGSNEGMLKLGGRTRRSDAVDEKIDLAVTLDFQVRDRRRAGVDYQLGFDGIILQNQLVLDLQLVELDKDPAKYYQELKDAVGPAAGKELLNAAQGVPYLQLATKIADGLIKAFAKNASDTVWKATPMFAVHPAIGAPYLRSGTYVVYEDPRGDLPPAELIYVDQELRRSGHSERIDRNHLLFAVKLTTLGGKDRTGTPLGDAVRAAV